MKHRTTIAASFAVALSACWDDGTIVRACAPACECGLFIGPDACAEVGLRAVGVSCRGIDCTIAYDSGEGVRTLGATCGAESCAGDP